jgi:glycosyltransferase involved in cell wall biosynthesis
VSGVRRIVFIITGLGTGGAEMMLLKLLQRLDRQRFEAHVVSLTSAGEIGAGIAALGIPVVPLGMRPGTLDPRYFFRLVRRLRRLQPDLVHTWMYHADLIGGVAARLAGVSAIAWCIRHSDFDQAKTSFSTRATVWLCARLSKWVPVRILSCSEQARAIHAAMGYALEKMVVVPNGFDLERFKPAAHARAALRAELGLAMDTPLVGLIGRFDPQKNHAGFFRAAGWLHRKMPRVHFVLAGQGIDGKNSELRQAVLRAGVGGNTHLLGLRGDMPSLMAALDLLASSSSFGEAFPNVIGEAMACGVPCVATDVGDSARIVGGTGRVVAKDDMAGLATALEALLASDESERTALGEQARARVAALFEIGQVVRRYEALYESLPMRQP